MAKNEIAKTGIAVPAPYFSAEQIELIKRQIAPGASNDELNLFLADCQRSRLDPFARQIYSIQRMESYRDRDGTWKKRAKRSTQISIDGFRLIAERTGEYAGQLGPEWCGLDGEWRDVWLDKNPPAAARVAVMRKDFQKPLWTVATFAEYAPRNDKGNLSGLWAKMPAGMIAKCAEALSLRRAFPRELSGLYSTEEMMQSVPADDTSVAQPLAEDLGDQTTIDYDLHAETDSVASGSAAPAAKDSPPTAAGAVLSLEDMAREAAMRGPDQLRMFFNKRTTAEKKRLREIEAELVNLYPPSATHRLAGG